jgi:hypothetical protein
MCAYSLILVMSWVLMSQLSPSLAAVPDCQCGLCEASWLRYAIAEVHAGARGCRDSHLASTWIHGPIHVPHIDVYASRVLAGMKVLSLSEEVDDRP